MGVSMSAAQYFDVFRGQAVPYRPPAPALPVAVPFPQQPSNLLQPITVALDTVMYTGRVPLSTWTFTVSIVDKLWVSDRTSLYFGIETRIHRQVYHDSVRIKDHRVNLDVSIAAYNNFGDVVKSVQPIRFYELGSKVHPSALLHVEHDWMQLLFKFRLVVHEDVPV